jgi:cell fate regulator YaaT (PSP1 superfamily)
MCCLNYEDEVYKKARKSLPDLGDLVVTPDGEGRIEGINYLTRVLKIHLRDKEVFAKYPADEVQVLRKERLNG